MNILMTGPLLLPSSSPKAEPVVAGVDVHGLHTSALGLTVISPRLFVSPSRQL